MARRAAASSYTVSGATVAALAGAVRARGVELGPVLARFGLEERALADPESRVEARVNDALWAAAVEATGEPDLGLRLARALDLDAFHLVGHLAASAATLGQALERVVAFSRLLHDAGRTELERHRGEAWLFPGCRGLPAPPPRQVAEFNTASAVALIRFALGRPGWHPEAVRFQHQAPAATAAHREALGVRPTFGAAEDVVVLAWSDLALPVRVSAPSALGRYLEGYARALLERLPPAGEDDLAGALLRQAVSALPSGGLSLQAAAARLGVTPRTLQRRLKDAGTSFATVLEEARLTTAEAYLRDGSLSLKEVSCLVGFSEPGTFHRAFKRWKGVTPGAFRAREP